jgi:light-regulated signal transduction histidine kinase (bacteriophytochrome)
MATWFIVEGSAYNDKPTKCVEIGVLDSSPARPVYYVRDNGIGIPEKHFESIFRIFKRLHARDRYGGGAGAGLTIVKRIVERHGGRIWLQSTAGQGTSFFFTLAEEVS